MSEFAEVLEGVGPRLRAIRTARSITLTDLAESTGISLSTLSRLESGQRKPTLELLLPLARAFQVALDELVDAPATGDPRVRMPAFVRHGATFVPLTRRPGGVQAFKQILPVGYPNRDVEPQTHEGYEWMYVLSGRVRLLLGDQGDPAGARGGRGVRHPPAPRGDQPRPRRRRGPQPLRPAGRAGARAGPAGEVGVSGPDQRSAADTSRKRSFSSGVPTVTRRCLGIPTSRISTPASR